MINKRIVNFISKRFLYDCNWLDGNCYYFAVILKDRFPKGEIVYDPIEGHFMFLYNGELYDWTGRIGKRDFVLWREFEKYDKSQYQRIVRDCVN